MSAYPQAPHPSAAPPARPAEGIRADLYRRLTSRALWTAFVLPALFATAAALAGQVTWLQAAAIVLGGGSVFSAVEGARDVARLRRRD